MTTSQRINALLIEALNGGGHIDVATWRTFADPDENGRGAEIRYLTE